VNIIHALQPRFANGDGALPALIAAQRFLAACEMALRPAALRVRLGFGRLRVPGGRPRRFGPPRASMARFSLSRSANSNARICSLGIFQMAFIVMHALSGSGLSSAQTGSANRMTKCWRIETVVVSIRESAGGRPSCRFLFSSNCLMDALSIRPKHW
jgi:hypothetical protein